MNTPPASYEPDSRQSSETVPSPPAAISLACAEPHVLVDFGHSSSVYVLPAALSSDGNCGGVVVNAHGCGVVRRLSMTTGHQGDQPRKRGRRAHRPDPSDGPVAALAHALLTLKESAGAPPMTGCGQNTVRCGRHLPGRQHGVGEPAVHENMATDQHQYGCLARTIPRAPAATGGAGYVPHRRTGVHPGHRAGVDQVRSSSRR